MAITSIRVVTIGEMQMSGNPGASTGSPVFSTAEIAEVVNARANEASAHAEMFRIRALRDRGQADSAVGLRYRALWVGVTLHRSQRACSVLSREMLAALDAREAAWDGLQQERARLSVDLAFGPEDGATMEGAGSPLPR